jgi:hypothetical protein
MVHSLVLMVPSFHEISSVSSTTSSPQLLASGESSRLFILVKLFPEVFDLIKDNRLEARGVRRVLEPS